MVVARYPVICFKNYDYTRLFDGDFIKKGSTSNSYVFEKIITIDTETYVYDEKEIGFVTDWTITIENDCCLYGNHVSDLIDTIDRICDVLHGDKNHTIIFYIHNLSYDYVFIRNHLLDRFSQPEHSLAVKSHRYVFLKWDSFGLELRDSAILTQRTLERLCLDMGTTEKAVGTWDYKKMRTPDSPRSKKEIAYVCTDTISLVKALRKYISDRGCNIANVPLTNTGFIRNKARSLSRKDKTWHKKFLSMKLTLQQYEQLCDCYHGGYTHANRYVVNKLITGNIVSYDFTSSYPARMVYNKFPMSQFVYTNGLKLSDVLKLKDKYAFSGYIRLTNVRLKKSCSMPPMAYHKAKVCLFPNHENEKLYLSYMKNMDNGKIVNADVVIYPFTDPDLEIILDAYDYESADVASVMRAEKDYLPDWFINYILHLYYNKTTLKEADKILYQISKGELNGCYGMTVQKILQADMREDFETGEWSDKLLDSEKDEKLEKYYKSKNAFLPYQWGVWVTAYAQAELYKLGACCNKWYYSDTDSVKGEDWNMDTLNNYNNSIMELSKKLGRGSVEFNGKTYTLGIADFDGDYTEFKTMGSKRYCYRENGVLKQTVAGVPKDGVYCLDNDINNFKKGMIYKNDEIYQRNLKANDPDAATKWKLRTEYLFHDSIKKIVIDGCEIEYGCSIRLSETEYELDHTIPYDEKTGMPLFFENDIVIY